MYSLGFLQTPPMHGWGPHTENSVRVKGHCMSRYVNVFRLPATTRSISLARSRALKVLEQWEVCADVCDRALLVLSELATNAVRHGSANGCRYQVALTLHTTLRIEVSDADSTRIPMPPPPGSFEENGRGLALVDLLAAKWGTELHPPAGKTVWAELETTEFEYQINPASADVPALRETAESGGAQS